MRGTGVLTHGFFLTALGAMAYAQYAVRRDPNDATGSWLLVLGAVLAAALLAARREPPPGSDEAPAPTVRFSAAGLSLLLLGAVTVAAGSVLLCIAWSSWFFVAWLLFLAGSGAATIGLRKIEPSPAPISWTRLEALSFVAIVALGTFLRFHRYAEFPDPFTTHAIEEQQTGYGGWQILTLGLRPWEFFVDHCMAALALWLAQEPSFLVIRVPFTIFSALTIVPVHLLLRQLVARGPALAGTFLFAVSSWNLIYSRVAHNIFLTNFFVVTVLALLVHFGRTRRLTGVPWLGLLSGYTLYSYAGYRGTPLFALVFLGGLAVADAWRALRGRDPGGGRKLGRDLVAAGITVAMVSALAVPLYERLGSGQSYYFEAASRSLANRDYYSSDFNALLGQRLDRIRNAARIFMHVGDDSPTFNAPREPMVDPFTAVLFLGGLCAALLRPRDRYGGFFVFLFVALMFGGTVFVQNLDVRRLQGITVLVSLFAAVFLDLSWRAFRPARSRRRAALAFILVGAGGIATGWWNYDVHFRKMAGDPRVREALKNQYTTLIRWGRSEGREREVLLLSLVNRFFDRGYYYRSHYTWLIDDVMRGRDLDDVHDLLKGTPPVENGRRPTAILQRPYEDEEIATLLRRIYPKTHCERFLEPDNPHVSFLACDLPADRRPRDLRMNLVGRYWKGDTPRGEPFLTREEPFLGYAVVPLRCAVAPCYAEWTVRLEITAGGTYHFQLDRRGASRLSATIDGHPIDRVPLDLQPGLRHLRVRAALVAERGSGVRLSWKVGGEWRLVELYEVPGE